jgi:hypothetical protein
MQHRHKKHRANISKKYSSYEKKINHYFEKHPTFNSIIHAIGGIGVGILITSTITIFFPLFTGIILLGICLLGHLYAHSTNR